MRGQFTTEYLSVYAWAILGIVVTVGALFYFGILDPQNYLPDRCVLDGQTDCLDFAASQMSTGPAVRFFIRNNYGFAMEQTRFNVSVVGEPGSTVNCSWLEDSGPGLLFMTPLDLSAGEGVEFYCPDLCVGTSLCESPLSEDGKSKYVLLGTFIPEDGQFDRNINGFIRTGFVTSQEPDIGVGPDTEPPHILFTAPANNSVQAGVQSLKVTAWDNVGIERVEFWNSTSYFIYNDTTPPYEVNFDMSRLAMFVWTPISATAYDMAGNSNTSTIYLGLATGGASCIFIDWFDRGTQPSLGTPTITLPYSPCTSVIGPIYPWREVEQGGDTVSLLNGQLSFTSNNEHKRPSANNSFSRLVSGVLIWNFTTHWEYNPAEVRYEVWYQLGDSELMSDDNIYDGVAVGLRYGDDQQAGCPSKGCFGIEWTEKQDVELTSINGEVSVGVYVDIDAKEYDVRIDNVPVGGSIPFTNDVEIDTLRVLAHQIGTAGFAGRSVDNMSIIASIPAFRPRIPVAPTVPAACVPETGLISYFDFDNPANLGEDIKGQYNLTNNGGAEDTFGVLSGALKLGPSDYLSINDAPLLYRDEFTVSAFVKVDTMNNNYGRVIQLGTAPDQDSGYGIEVDSGSGSGNKRIYAVIWNTTSGWSPRLRTAGIQTVGSWYHVALTYNKSAVRYYVDGNLVDSVTKTMSAPTPTTSLFVGGYPSTGNYFEGSVDELAFFNRTLSQPEVQDLANRVPVCFIGG